jgi:hypothetical protein
MSRRTTAARIADATPDEIVALRIDLLDTEPPIWREVEAPTSITLKVLHDIVQQTMQWCDYHLWEFEIGGTRYGPDDLDDGWREEPARPAAKARLRDFLSEEKTVIGYTYDFGDNWQLRIVASAPRAGDPGVLYPRYVGGALNAPPEDCGGIGGFYDLIDALADETHPLNEDIGDRFEDYDPAVIDEELIHIALKRIARARTGGLKMRRRKTA